MKYIQKQNIGFRNEYANMPSLDFAYLAENRALITANESEIDWNVVKSICEKHGFDFTIINGTFCTYDVGGLIGYSSEVVIYKKIGLDTKEFEKLEDNKEYGKIRELTANYDDLFLKLHNCVNELDEETDLVFETCLSGNVGLFSGYDFCYSSCDILHSWRKIIDIWSPLIHDTNYKLKKGVYIFMCSRWIKTFPKD